ncbi:MAG: hypothetical protein ACREON_10390 [Gemmatimonadaceae bacterium]
MTDLQERHPAATPDRQISTRRARGRVTAIIVLSIVTFAGIATGVALDRFVLMPRQLGPPAGVGMGRFGPGSPASERGQAIRERMARELALTPEQRLQFDSIMSRQMRALRVARESIRPRMDSLVRETRRQIDAILTPAQRERLRELPARGVFGTRGGRFDSGRHEGPPFP